MKEYKVSSELFINWRTRLIKNGGRKQDLDWLIDIKGGIRWIDLQRVLINSQHSLTLSNSLEEIEELWNQHLDDFTPLQYLVGICPWREFHLEVDPSVLIPRQETELLIDFALKAVKNSTQGIWADLGTGSGALAIALAKALPDWQGKAVDCSKDALTIAQRNLRRLVPEGAVSVHCGSWWEPLQPFWGEINLVLANPPYIPSSLINSLEPVVSRHEPHIALSGGGDGLVACREIIDGAMKGLSKGGWLLMEHHFDQSDAVLLLMGKAGLVDLRFEKDLDGFQRFAIGRRP